MTAVLNAVLWAAFAAAVGGAVHLWRVHVQGARRDALRAMAARRGWALTETGLRLGRAGALRVVPRGGAPWTLDASAGGAATWAAEQPRWADGTLIVLLGPSGEAAEVAPGDLRRRLGADWAGRIPMLDPVPAPEGVVAFARPDPGTRVILGDVARALAAWPGEGPAIMLGPEGLALRLPRPLDRAERIEPFIDLALELGRVLRA